MNELSKQENSTIPFSRRYTLREIWIYLNQKYSASANDTTRTISDPPQEINA